MTTLSEAKESIYSRFVTEWAAATPFVFDNEELEDLGNDPWVRVTVRSLTRGQDTLGRTGNRRFRSSALVFVQVYTRTNIGVKQGDDLAVQAKDIFEAVSFSGLDFNDGVVRESGPQGKWYQHVVEIAFDYDEIK